LYTYIGDDFGVGAGSDAVAGMAACFLAGTLSSLLAALITIKIDDQESGLKCGPCLTIRQASQNPETISEDEAIDGESNKR
jgi:hypothetical protein